MTVELRNINSPEDLKKLSLDELPELAHQVREMIISVVSETGGHLAPSLGAVELTIGLHYVFDAPRDKIIWDVGHQSYTHKILTGRRDSFFTLRQAGGISGFPKRDESPYDAFGTGHASTSISSGLGMACARDLKGEDFHVISVIGDGAMTGGLAYEGLNQAGALNRNFIVVLNDNAMSISRNVGGLAKYLTSVIRNPLYNRLKARVWEMTGKLPDIGDKIRVVARWMEESLKGLITPGMWFEELGFRYFGPVDGHDIPELVKVFQDIKNLPGPLLVHVITRKGKGYPPAEKNSRLFHGVGPFEVKTGELKSRAVAPTYSRVFGDALLELARENERIVAVTAAMVDNTGLRPFADAFPDRIFDVGIAEGHSITFAAGMAAEGLVPVVAIYSSFLQRALDQLIHDVAIQRLPVRLAIDRGGIVGDDGATHNGVFDLSFLRMIPGMVIMVPKDEAELRHMLFTAVNYDRGPVAVRYPRGPGFGVPLDKDFRAVPLVRAEVLADGDHLSIWAVGAMVNAALEARKLLSAKGIRARVVNARFVKPLDTALLAHDAGRYELIVTLEENTRMGGFGSAVLESCAELGRPTGRVLTLGVPDRFIEHGNRAEIIKGLGLDSAGLARKVLETFNQAHIIV